MKSTNLTLCAVVIIAAPIPAAWISDAVAQTEPLNCDDWNTLEFFEVATVDDVTACLAMGANVHARSDDGHTPLHRAADVNASPAVLEALLDAGADMHAQAARDGHTPLHEASGNPELGMIEYLLQSGGDPEALTTDGATLLHYAAWSNQNPVVVDFLIADGADVNARRDDGITPLHNAARNNGNPAIVERLLAAGAEINPNGPSPLYAAAENNDNPAVVEALIDAGADLNAGLSYSAAGSSSPLYAAASSNDNPAVIDVILRAGVDVNGGMIDERTGTGGYVRLALHSAVVDNDNPEVIETLLRAGADPYLEVGYGTALHVAAMTSSRNMVPVMQMLIDEGMDSNVRDRNGDTPLHQVGRPDSAEFLLANGADPLRRDENNNTVLHRPGVSWDWVTEESDEIMSLVSLLAAAGADVNARNENGETPLHLVRNAEQANALVTQGADPRHRDASGNTALHSTFRWFEWDSEEALELVALFVNAGGDVNARNQNGRTPMHDVTLPAGVNALLAHGADINAQDEEGNTRLHLAAGCEFCINASELVIALLDAGADATIRNAQGQTPWDLASANEDEEFSGSEGYWHLNDARFNTPSPFDPTAGSSGPGGTVTQNRQRGASTRDSGFQGFELPDENRREAFGDPPPVARVTQSAGGGQCEFQWMLDDSPPPTDITDIRLSWCNAPDTMIQIHLRANAAATQQCQLVYWERDSRPSADIDGLAATIRRACAYLDAESATNNVNCRCPDWYGR